MRVLFLCVALLVLGCGSPKPEAKPTTIAEPMPVPERPKVVVNKRAVRAMLATPSAPSPTKAALDMHGDAAIELRRLATTDADLPVRVKAIEALRHYPEPATRRLLAHMQAADKLHPDLRAAVEATLKVLPPA